MYGSGNFVVIYLVGLLVIIFCIKSIIACIRKNDSEEARALVAGLAIILLSALPLVAIIFLFRVGVLIFILTQDFIIIQM